MSRFWIGLAMLLCLNTYAVAADQPAKVPPTPSSHPAVPAMGSQQKNPWKVFRLRFAPAANIAVTLNDLVRAEHPDAASRVAIVADTDANVLLVSGPPEVVEEVQKLIQVLDSRPPADSEEQRSIEVLRLRNSPAAQLAQTITAVLSAMRGSGRPATIVPDSVGNNLVVYASRRQMREVDLLVAKLDRAAAMIRLEVAIGDVPTASLPAAKAGTTKDATPIRVSFVGVEEAQKNMEILFRGQLTTLDNQAAYLQAARREPTISAVNTTAAGQFNSVNTQNLGMLLRFTPRLNAARVVTTQLEINDSRLAPADEGVPIYSSSKGEVIRAPVCEVLAMQATVKVADGQTVLLSDMSRQAKDGKQRVILITVHVLPSVDQAKPAK